MPSSTSEASALAITNIAHRYDGAPVLNGVDLTVAPGEVVCLLGASGSGKSTLLRLIAGLESLQQGEIRLGEVLLATPGRGTAPENRRSGLVFQDHVLFPHLTVAKNIAFGLKSLSADARRVRVEELLATVGLSGLADRYPHTLSGGQQQRVALARALAPEPAMLLLDEPFASVDSTLRRRLREETRRMLKAAEAPSLVVTHDAEEAMELGDRIAVMHAGKIAQLDTPQALWQRPTHRAIAELICRSDAFSGVVTDDGVQTPFGRLAYPAGELAVGTPVDVIARPDSVIADADAGAGAESPATVVDVRFAGDHYVTLLSAGVPTNLGARGSADLARDGELLRARSHHEPNVTVGQQVGVRFAPTGVFVYSRE